MKTLIALLLSSLSCFALDWTYSTNLYYNLTYPTNIYMGTNATDGATNGDTFYQWGTKINGFMLTYNRDKANFLKPGNQSIGGVGFTNGNVSASYVSATNFYLSQPRWVDALAGGLTLAGGIAAPEKAAIPNSGSWIAPAEGYRYGYGGVGGDDYASFEIQAWHVMATINASFPSLYYEPHIHVCVADISAGTNATFVLEWTSARVNDLFTNYYIRTNTYGFTKTNEHGILSFGNITNNALAGHASVMFKGTVRRTASATNDVGSGAAPNQGRKVFVESLDFHIPVRVLGSAGQYSGE